MAAKDTRAVNWTEVAVITAVILGVVVAAYAGLRSSLDEPPAAAAALPAPAAAMPFPQPSPTISLLPPEPPPSTVPSRRKPAPTSKPASSSRPVTPPAAARQLVIASTSMLTTGQSWSTDRLKLTVNRKGDLVLKDHGKAVWRTGTTTGVKLVMQNDGHLVLYDAANVAVFSSGTAGNPGAVLILRADGDMVVSLKNRILFRTGTGD